MTLSESFVAHMIPRTNERIVCPLDIYSRPQETNVNYFILMVSLFLSMNPSLVFVRHARLLQNLLHVLVRHLSF